MLRQEHLIAVVTFLIGCAFLLLVVGCSGTPSEAPNKKELGRTAEATASKEEARCEGTRTFHRYYVYKADKVRSGSEEDMKKAGKTVDWGVYTTNDLPGCPKGGLLLGTDKPDNLYGGDGKDEVRGLGYSDTLEGGVGDDHIYGGPGGDGNPGGVGEIAGNDGDDVLYGGAGTDGLSGGKGDDVLHAGPNGVSKEFPETIEGDDGDDVLYGGDGRDELSGGEGKDVLYGGDGPDLLSTKGHDKQRDELYCGKGNGDTYIADKNDYVDSSCEAKFRPRPLI